MTLTEFLLARIAEDEVVARAASLSPWHVDGAYGVANHAAIAEMTSDYTEDAEHIARWDPARVLAECEAKGRIVEEHSTWTFGHDHDGSSEEYGACLTLRLFASVYADHPDHQQEWAL